MLSIGAMAQTILAFSFVAFSSAWHSMPASHASASTHGSCSDGSALAPGPCTGCVASKLQDQRWLDIPCDCGGSESNLFGELVIDNEVLVHGSCNIGWEASCVYAPGCSWRYDLALVLNPDRPENCHPDGVWADKTGWPNRIQILSYDFGTLTSSAANCDEGGAKTGNQVWVTIHPTETSATNCAGVIMKVQCSACAYSPDD